VMAARLVCSDHPVQRLQAARSALLTEVECPVEFRSPSGGESAVRTADELDGLHNTVPATSVAQRQTGATCVRV
jgi:hypothetical protein